MAAKPTKRLVDLNPCWVGAGGEGVRDAQGKPIPRRDGIGIMFDCPCGSKSHDDDSNHVYVAFRNPLDGGPAHASGGEPTWERTGETFETLTLRPSILRRLSCRWHGFVTAGEVQTV